MMWFEHDGASAIATHVVLGVLSGVDGTRSGFAIDEQSPFAVSTPDSRLAHVLGCGRDTCLLVTDESAIHFGAGSGVCLCDFNLNRR